MSNPVLRTGSDDEWDDLLRRLPQAVPVPPFFYERVRARLVSRAEAPFWQLPAWLRRPTYAALLAVLILAVSGDEATAAPDSGPPAPAAHPRP